MAKRPLTDDEIVELIGEPPATPSIEPLPDRNEEFRKRFYAKVAGWLVHRISLDGVRASVTPDTVPEFIQELEAFVDSALPGDECWEFSSPQETWNQLAGRAGYALVRNGVVVNVLGTLLS